MNFGFNAPGLEQLFNDLNDAQVKIGPAVRAVVSRGALNVKTDARARFEAQRVGNYLPHYSRSITYDVETVGHVTTAQVGPDTTKAQASFGPFLEYGSAKTPPLPHLNPALDAEEPNFMDHLGAAAVGVLRS